MYHITLESQEVEEINGLLDDVTETYRSVEDQQFIHNASIYAHELPRRLRKSLHDFKQMENCDGNCVVSGMPINDAVIGPTPSHWRNKGEVSPTLREEIFFMLVSNLLGDPIAWATQQAGYIMHEVVPIQEYEKEQLGFSSQQNLEWHTEDAFHPYRADYLGLMCLRNPTKTPTTVSSVKNLDLTDPKFRVLFEPHFSIKPDESHLEKNRALDKKAGEAPDVGEVDYEEINRMNTNPDRIPVLFGDPKSPYMRLDPYFMLPAANEEAEDALAELIQQLEWGLTDVTLQPGDLLFVDNYRLVHGRSPFKARYDGTDRWLKRLNITRDLRKSRDARTASTCRKIR